MHVLVGEAECHFDVRLKCISFMQLQHRLYRGLHTLGKPGLPTVNQQSPLGITWLPERPWMVALSPAPRSDRGTETLPSLKDMTSSTGC